MEKIDQLSMDVRELSQLVALMSENLNYLSQRVAWGEVCFQQVKDSGVMTIAGMTKQVMEDHKKLKTQFNMLNMRVDALIKESGGSGESGGGEPPRPAPTLTRKFGR